MNATAHSLGRVSERPFGEAGLGAIVAKAGSALDLLSRKELPLDRVDGNGVLHGSEAGAATEERPLTGHRWLIATDEELLRAIALGASDAFDELFTRYARRTYGLLNRLAAGRADPEDLLQETFLRVVQHAGAFREGASFRPWLFTIARNIAYNAVAYADRRNGLEVKMDPGDLNPLEREHYASDPSTIAEENELKRLLPDALDRLPLYHREILVLIFFEGLTYDEAAEVTGDPAGTLRSRIFHALKKLREMLKVDPNRRQRSRRRAGHRPRAEAEAV